MIRGEDFWTRRKASVAEEQAAEDRARDAAELAAEQAAREERPDNEILEELGLPDPEALGPGDDFRGFMAKAVPDRIRRRALRRLWRVNPALANLDGLIDYGEDFTDGATVIENLQTTYQVGKGMLSHIEEMARQAEEPKAETAPSDDQVADAAEEVEAAPDAGQVTQISDAAEPAASQTIAPEEDGTEETAVIPRRRMQFTFDSRPGGAA